MKTIASILLIATALPAWGQDLYKTGRDAYKDKDYVTALEYLFAYRIQHQEELKKHPEFLAQLNDSIKNSENLIRTSLEMSLSMSTRNDRGFISGAKGYQFHPGEFQGAGTIIVPQ